MEALCLEDDKVKAASHVRTGIRKVFSFGKFEGIVGEFTKEVVQRLTDNPLIEKITPDIIVNAVDFKVQPDAPLHLVRLSQEGSVNIEDDSEYFYDDRYLGQGVNAYVIDTGVFVEHPEFEERAVLGPNFSDDVRHIDYVGHGTHVAGVIASKTFGVAKKTRIISIKTLDRHGLGALSAVIAGLEYAVNHRADSGSPGVANLSLGAARSAILDSAVEAAVDSGLVVVVAAGNNNMDACRASPAGSPYALTVGAIDDKRDRVASFSNWGCCVDIFSSGVDVESLSNNPFDYVQTKKLSGTSMASPVVAGVVATLLGGGTKPEDLRGQLYRLAIDGAIARTSLLLRPGSPNRIASTGVRENSLGNHGGFNRTNLETTAGTLVQ
ncbi:DEKNAAC103796 [Brettanomyces naardenensis]|uniref:DEKNAAC103796 n=1 Tax=Brettanomyces naardenensis TaxID=13370 RepID=A0A448YP78_BRENA|nr:DEKNAAC103796 [Brettanomyces naardenensis]